MRARLAVAFFAVFFLFTGAFAFDKTDLERIKEIYHCPGCDLSGASLVGIDLAYANLRKANLSKADLSGVQLGEANLTEADLSGANLTGTKLNMTNLEGADLSGANMTGARLYKADLRGADLSGADLSGALWVDGKKCAEGSVGKCEKQGP